MDSNARVGRSRPLVRGDLVVVLVEDPDVPAGHRPSHRSFADFHPGEVPDERIRLGQPVVVEHRYSVLLPEPPNRFRIERLTGRADSAEPARVAGAGVGNGHHRAHRGRGREDVRDLVPREEVELLVRVEAAFTLVDALNGTEPPGPE